MYLLLLGTYDMSEELVNKLFVAKTTEKCFTKAVASWFEQKTGISVGTSYQRNKNATYWWAFVIYCNDKSCKQEYKLKASIRSLNAGSKTEVTVYSKEDDYCIHGKLYF